MKIKNFISIISIFIVFFLAGCNDKKIEVSIKPEINEYSPMMSSVPGIPLNAIVKTNIKNENVKLHWVTEQGTLLKWQQDGKINILGKNIKTNEQKVYWTVDIKEKIKESSFRIYLTIGSRKDKYRFLRLIQKNT